jgi:hypothetical protein
MKRVTKEQNTMEDVCLSSISRLYQNKIFLSTNKAALAQLGEVGHSRSKFPREITNSNSARLKLSSGILSGGSVFDPHKPQLHFSSCCKTRSLESLWLNSMIYF